MLSRLLNKAYAAIAHVTTDIGFGFTLTHNRFTNKAVTLCGSAAGHRKVVETISLKTVPSHTPGKPEFRGKLKLADGSTFHFVRFWWGTPIGWGGEFTMAHPDGGIYGSCHPSPGCI